MSLSEQKGLVSHKRKGQDETENSDGTFGPPSHLKKSCKNGNSIISLEQLIISHKSFSSMYFLSTFVFDCFSLLIAALIFSAGYYSAPFFTTRRGVLEKSFFKSILLE